MTREEDKDFSKRKGKRESLISSRRKKSAKMEIPSLTFLSAGFINPEAIWSKAEEMSTKVDEAFGSLSIDMVEVEDQRERGTKLLPFLQR